MNHIISKMSIEPQFHTHKVCVREWILWVRRCPLCLSSFLQHPCFSDILPKRNCIQFPVEPLIFNGNDVYCQTKGSWVILTICLSCSHCEGISLSKAVSKGCGGRVAESMAHTVLIWRAGFYCLVQVPHCFLASISCPWGSFRMGDSFSGISSQIVA